MSDCLFCKIITRKIPAEIVFEDDAVLAFKDIKPVAPVHILVIPKKHIASLPVVSVDDATLLGEIQIAVSRIAAEQDIEDAYRVTLNAGRFQEVPHLHYHLLGGEKGGK